jgi:E3 ubiquitin-protein ligase HUWE1
MALFAGERLDAYFTRSFYKHMLNIAPSYADVESIDPDYYKSLKWILENPIEGVMDLTFSHTADEFGKPRVFDLLPNGQHIAVTDENKVLYVLRDAALRCSLMCGTASCAVLWCWCERLST